MNTITIQINGKKYEIGDKLFYLTIDKTTIPDPYDIFCTKYKEDRADLQCACAKIIGITMVDVDYNAVPAVMLKWNEKERTIPIDRFDNVAFCTVHEAETMMKLLKDTDGYPIQAITNVNFDLLYIDLTNISDGNATFDSLYQNYAAMLAVIIDGSRHSSWKSRQFCDDNPIDGDGMHYFYAGIDLPSGTVFCRYPIDKWDLFNCKVIPKKKEGLDLSKSSSAIWDILLNDFITVDAYIDANVAPEDMTLLEYAIQNEYVKTMKRRSKLNGAKPLKVNWVWYDEYDPICKYMRKKSDVAVLFSNYSDELYSYKKVPVSSNLEELSKLYSDNVVQIAFNFDGSSGNEDEGAENAYDGYVYGDDLNLVDAGKRFIKEFEKFIP